MTGNSKNRESADAIALTGLAQAQERYDAFLCDIWGVLHNGERAFAPAVETLGNCAAAARR